MWNRVERRHTPRVEPSGRLEVQSGPVDGITLTLVDVSQGGFLVSAALPMIVDDIQDYVFATDDGRWSRRLRARVVYSHRRSGPQGWPVEYMSGLAFCDMHLPTVQAATRELVARAEPADVAALGGGPYLYAVE